jgi:hypothetical protein
LNIIIGSPRVGKTQRLIESFKKDPKGILLVPNKLQKKLMVERGVPADRIFITNYDSLKGVNCNLYIDNVGMILRTLFNQEIKMISLDKWKIFDLDKEVKNPYLG